MGKSIRDDVLFTLDVLDDIGKRLNEFTPFSMMLVQLSLTLEILQGLMIGMINSWGRR